MAFVKMCVNWKVVGALSLVGIAVLALAPRLVGAALPLLVFAACPLSMLLMMRRMSRDRPGPSDPAPGRGAEPGLDEARQPGSMSSRG